MGKALQKIIILFIVVSLIGCKTIPNIHNLTRYRTISKMRALSDKCIITAFAYMGADKIYISAVITEYRKNNKDYKFDDIWSLYKQDYLYDKNDWWIIKQYKATKLLYKFYRKNPHLAVINKKDGIKNEKIK